MGVLTRGQYTFGTKTKTEIFVLTAPVSLTGTAGINSGTTTLNGVGTLFTQELLVGDNVRFSSSGYAFTIASIVSNTQAIVVSASPITIATSSVIQLLNPKRIKFGASVFNITDRYPMYYSGNNGSLTIDEWKMGAFCNGQVVPVANASVTTAITEGQVLQTSVGAIQPYTSGLDPAIAVAYSLVYGDCCVGSAVCGIHNTDSSGAIPKGYFTQPNSAGSNVISDGATSTADNCGIGVTASGTPVAGEIEMMVNFHERL